MVIIKWLQQINCGTDVFSFWSFLPITSTATRKMNGHSSAESRAIVLCKASGRSNEGLLQQQQQKQQSAKYVIIAIT